MMGPVLLVAFVVLGEVNGFTINLVKSEYTELSPGGNFTLMCGTDSHYEHCDWKHPGGTKACNFEWKHISGSVQMQECHQLIDRVVFAGDYDKHECGITVSNAVMEDTGVWTCEVEQYVWGDWSRGTIVTATINVSVVASTTALPSTATAATTLTSLSTTTTIVTTAAPTTTVTTPTTTVTTPTTTVTTPMTTQKQPPGITSSTAAVTEQTTTNKHQETGGELREPSVVPEPVPQKGRTDKSSDSTSVVVGVLLVLVVVGVLVGVVFYYRKRNVANCAVHYKPDCNDRVILI